MKTTTPFFSGFHFQTLRRKPRSAQQVFADELAAVRRKSFAQLDECFGRYIPARLLRPKESGQHSRQRFFSQANTFWAFFSQILDPDGGCREVVAKLQAYAALRTMNIPSGSTAAYCKARKKLSESDLNEIFESTAGGMADKGEVELVGGRRVIVVDGTGLSMPDTPENQQVWPQFRTQKTGCGFPAASIVGCFSLHNSALLSYELGNKHDSEPELFRKQWEVFRSGDILLGDKMYCNYFDMAMLLRRGVDTLAAMPMNSRKSITRNDSIDSFAQGDLLIQWKKPRWNKKSAYTRAEWEELPERLTLRQIEVEYTTENNETGRFFLISTMLDSEAHPAEQLKQLYFRRWEIELFFRDIKTCMGMDVLRCKTPGMIRKEILMHFIVYNSIRRLIYEAAQEYDVQLRRISFKGALQSIRHWEPNLYGLQLCRRERTRILSQLHESITRNPLPERPGRRESRCTKRRPKCYPYLNVPRHELNKRGKHASNS